MYTQIFQEIISIMHHDYAGYTDKRGWDQPNVYKTKISSMEKQGILTANVFMEIVQEYLLDFQDPHLSFSLVESDSQKNYDNGFRVRRYKERLYVTSVTSEKRLELGDSILSLNQIPVLELVEKHQRELMESKAEREDWRKVISKYHDVEVFHAGDKRNITLKKYEKEAYKPKHTIEYIGNDTLLMTLSDFFEPSTIDYLLDKHKASLESTSNLIIDVRTNLGGSTFAFKGLERYLYPDEKNKIDLSFYKMKVNYTKRNADLMIEAIDKELKNIDKKADRESLKRWKEETWEKYRGKGFINSINESDEDTYKITGADFPKNIIVLTDNYCGSAGDIFVYLCIQSPKTKVIGRPTMGVNDYSNLAEIIWDNQFKLMYGTSRMDQIDYRELDAEPGIKPDIYIPWTPEHIYNDVDMEKAMEILART